MSVTPVDADVQLGGERKTQHQEDSMLKVQTGDTQSDNYTAEIVNQATSNIQEYPLWLILAFAAAVGFALPSPLSYLSARRERKTAQRQIEQLTQALTASQPISTTKPEEKASWDN